MHNIYIYIIYIIYIPAVYTLEFVANMLQHPSAHLNQQQSKDRAAATAAVAAAIVAAIVAAAAAGAAATAAARVVRVTAVYVHLMKPQVFASSLFACL